MVASAGFPTRLAPLDQLKVAIRPQTGWDKFLDIMLEIITVSLATTRWGDDELPDEEAASVKNEVKRLLADPTAGPILRSQFKMMRRDQAFLADDAVANQLKGRISGQNPAEVRQAVSFAFRALMNELDPIAPLPTLNEGFDALTRQLSGVLQPQAVARAQGDDFARFMTMFGTATHPVTGDEGVRSGVGLGLEILTLGLATAAINGDDREHGPGILTGDELRAFQVRCENELPQGDRRIMGTALRLLVQRQGVLLRDTNAKEIEFAATCLTGEIDASAQGDASKAAMSDVETKTASILASMMAMDLATAGLIPGPHQWLETLHGDQEEALRGKIATQLRADLSALPPSLQRVVRTALQKRVSEFPEQASSPALTQLRLLAK